MNEEICCRLPLRSFRAASRARERSRIASCRSSGTQTAVRSPARNSLARPTASRRLTVFGSKYGDGLARRCFRGVDLAEIANLPTTTLLRDRNGIAQIRRIDSDESTVMLVHDSPSLFEALPGQSG